MALSSLVDARLAASISFDTQSVDGVHDVFFFFLLLDPVVHVTWALQTLRSEDPLHQFALCPLPH
jgi:hypothetical protein